MPKFDGATRKIAARMKKSGKSNRCIATAIGCSPTTAALLVKTGRKTDPMKGLKKPGPKPLVSNRMKLRLRRSLENVRNPRLRGYQSVRDFKRRVKTSVIKNASDRTARRILKEVCKWSPRRTGLVWGDEKSRKKIMSQRIKWCETQLANKVVFSHTCFVDACKVRLPKCAAERAKFAASLQAANWWAVRNAARGSTAPTKMGKSIAWHSSFVKMVCVRDGKTERTKAYWYEKNMCGKTFEAILKKINKDFPLKDRILVTDNDSSQLAGINRAKKAGIVGRVLKQPARSPDLSALDARVFPLLLPKVSRWVDRQKGRTTEKQMKAAIVRLLKTVDKSMVGWEKKWRERCRRVVEAKGELLPN